MYDCKILADSIASSDDRLITFQVTYPRFIHSEFLTHSMLVRNSESSRARPVLKNIEDVQGNKFVPEVFGQNQPGMQFENTLDEDQDEQARELWVHGASEALWVAKQLAKLDVHKSHVNRLLEPYKWHTAIYSGTDWKNFFALRTHKDAQPEFRTIALMMAEAYHDHEPAYLPPSQWHLPLVSEDEIDTIYKGELSTPSATWDYWRKVAIGRCARVSYLTHHGKRDPEADIALHDQLLSSGHMSPFGHIARPFTYPEWRVIDILTEDIEHEHETNGQLKPRFYHRLMRNLSYCAQYRGWWQARADIPSEHDATKLLGD